MPPSTLQDSSSSMVTLKSNTTTARRVDISLVPRLHPHQPWRSPGNPLPQCPSKGLAFGIFPKRCFDPAGTRGRHIRDSRTITPLLAQRSMVMVWKYSNCPCAFLLGSEDVSLSAVLFVLLSVFGDWVFSIPRLIAESSLSCHSQGRPSMRTRIGFLCTKTPFATPHPSRIATLNHAPTLSPFPAQCLALCLSTDHGVTVFPFFVHAHVCVRR